MATPLRIRSRRAKPEYVSPWMGTALSVHTCTAFQGMTAAHIEVRWRGHLIQPGAMVRLVDGTHFEEQPCAGTMTSCQQAKVAQAMAERNYESNMAMAKKQHAQWLADRAEQDRRA